MYSLINSSPMFDGSGGCPTDVTVGSYTLPLSQLCAYLPILSVALQGFAYLIALFVVFRKGN